MIPRGIAVVLAGLMLAPAAWGQAAGQMRWQAGQVLVYRAEHTTFAADSAGDSRAETRTRLVVTKRWQVLGVDAAGVATLQLSLQSLLSETTTPNGAILRFDSSAPDKSTPELREQLARFVGQPLAVLRVDNLGRVVEVKESKFGPASNFEHEPPFVAVLPGDGPRPGQTWDRAYQITLAPPQGTGEKYPAVQHYTCKGINGSLAAVQMNTEVKSLPQAEVDQVPLWQMQPKGEVVFDVQAGRLQSAVLDIDRELKGHQGEGSVCRFQSHYVVQYVGDH